VTATGPTLGRRGLGSVDGVGFRESIESQKRWRMTGQWSQAFCREQPPAARSRLAGVVALVLAVGACGGTSGRAAPTATHVQVRATVATSGTTYRQTTVPTTTGIKPTVPSTSAVMGTTRATTGVVVAAPPTSAPQTIDLCCEAGVTPAEQLRAEALIESTIVDLKRFEFPAEAYAAGYRSIGDGSTGDEHYVNWSYVDDGHILDPMRPESVVYEYRGGEQVAVAAMYMLPFDSTFADVPDVGGPLTQWHVHRNLCLTESPDHKVLSGLTSDNGTCPAGTNKAGNTPMLHVWVVPNPCGPFAALEGIGAGQVPPGQTRNCDTKFASVP